MSDSWSVFDVIGPVMVGPSSSHTAGAARIGYFARNLNGQQPKKVKLRLHGSFGKVCNGHCTDKAIIGGLLGYLPHSDKIKNAKALAKEAGMEVVLSLSNLGDTVHPNSVRIEMKNSDGSFHRMRAKSIGGGKIVIREIDKVDCNIGMSYSCLVVMMNNNKTKPVDLIDKIRQHDMRIINFDTSHYKDQTLLTVEIHEHFTSDIVHELKSIPGVEYCRFLNHISNYDRFAID